MNPLTTYQIFSRSIILLAFTSLCLANSITYLIADLEHVVVELCDFSDGESEQEEQKNEELLDDKFPIEFGISKQALLKRCLTAFTHIDLKSSLNREILTPPPEWFVN